MRSTIFPPLHPHVHQLFVGHERIRFSHLCEQVFQSAPTVEFSHRLDHRIALGGRLRVPHSFFEDIIRNIDRRFHIPIIGNLESQVN